jgi:hypothetical protein
MHAFGGYTNGYSEVTGAAIKDESEGLNMVIPSDTSCQPKGDLYGIFAVDGRNPGDCCIVRPGVSFGSPRGRRGFKETSGIFTGVVVDVAAIGNDTLLGGVVVDSRVGDGVNAGNSIIFLRL